MSAIKRTAILGSGMLAALAVSIAAEPAEWALYDVRVPLRRDHGWPKDLVQVPITEKDLAALGGWPLPAAVLVAILDRLEEAGAKTIVLDMFLGTAGNAEDEALVAKALTRTVTAITFDPRNGRAPTADEIRAAMIPVAGEGPAADAASLAFPPEAIATAAARLGHAGFVQHASIRSSPPLVRVTGFEGALPSQALAALIEHRGIDPAKIEVTPRSIRLPDRDAVPLRDGETLLDLTPGRGPQIVTVPDLLNGLLGRRSLSRVLVVVHVDTPEDRHRSALGDATPGGLLLASAIRTLDDGAQPRFFPAWAAILIAGSAIAAAMRVPDRRRRLLTCAAAEATFLAGAFALVPLADVFLPILPALVVFAAGIAACVIAVSDSASASGGPGAPS